MYKETQIYTKLQGLTEQEILKKVAEILNVELNGM